MKREIKFRIWNGAEMVHDITAGKFGVFYVNPTNNGLDPNDSASITLFTTKYHEGTPLMQFTGLLDRNGKEIYEGDVLKLKSSITGYKNIGPVKWHRYELFSIGDILTWCADPIALIPNSYKKPVINNVEVIGNTHEHPELLKLSS